MLREVLDELIRDGHVVPTLDPCSLCASTVDVVRLPEGAAVCTDCLTRGVEQRASQN